jgi:hypothetical protein
MFVLTRSVTKFRVFFIMGSGYVSHMFRDAVYLGLPIVPDRATTADRLYNFLLLSVAHFVAHCGVAPNFGDYDCKDR